MSEELLIPQFAEVLEDRYGKGIYRKIKVIPSNGVYKKKPVGEKSNMKRDEIIKNRVGCGDWDNYSFAIKYCEELYVVDFDTKIFKNPELFNTLKDLGAYHTETVKGWHFYINISGLPDFKNEVDIANLEYNHLAADVDLLCQKRNVWEPSNRVVKGASFVSVEWDDIAKYFNKTKMNFLHPEGVEEEELPVVVNDSDDIVVQAVEVSIQTCDEETMRGFLNRLKPDRKNDYETWRNVSMAIYTNFYELDDLLTGYILFDEWSQSAQGYNKITNKRIWQSFATRPDNPLTYKSIKRLADEDSTENAYESIYLSRGSDALVEFINETYTYNKANSNIIYMDNGKHYLKKMGDVKNDLAMYGFMVSNPSGKDKYIAPDEIWKHSPKRKCVRAIDFDPTESKFNIYNLWKGYFLTHENTSDADENMCYPILTHIKKVWCAGNEDYCEYVLNWFAWILQKPESKIGVMLCIRSRQGGGKGTILGMIGHIMDGDRDTGYYSQCSNLESIIGNFTTGIEGKCLINFDEAFWGGDKKKEGMIKNLITETNQEIRVKNHNPYNIKNTTAFVLTTNAERFSGVTKDDRRHFCLECDDSHIDKMSKDELNSYYTEICGRKYDQPENVDMCSSFAKVLYHRDLSRFNPQEFPKTELAFNQIQQGWSSVVKFWFHALNTGVLFDDGECVCRIDGSGIGDWDVMSGPRLPGIWIEAKNGVAEHQKIFATFVYYAYKHTDLGGYNAHAKECETQFWSITKRMFRKDELHKGRHEDTDGVLKRVIEMSDIDTLRQSFKQDQKVEHLDIYDHELD